VSATLQISAAVSVALIGGLFFTLAPDGASASKVQAAFAVASLTIGLSLALSAGLSWKRSE
jgi:hypothetical protein